MQGSLFGTQVTDAACSLSLTLAHRHSPRKPQSRPVHSVLCPAQVASETGQRETLSPNRLVPEPWS